MSHSHLDRGPVARSTETDVEPQFQTSETNLAVIVNVELFVTFYRSQLSQNICLGLSSGTRFKTALIQNRRFTTIPHVVLFVRRHSFRSRLTDHGIE